MEKNLYFLSKLLGSKSFLILYIVANNRLLLTIYNTLANIEVNSYLFINVKFGCKMLKIFSIEEIINFKLQPIGRFDRKAIQLIDLVLKAYVTIQRQTLCNKHLIVIDLPYNIIIS